MTKCASGVGRAASSRVSTLTPANHVSNFDHVVTQWIAPRYSERGSGCASSQVQLVGDSTRPSTVMLHVSGAMRGVGSAVSTGQSVPTSYCPGGRRGSRSRRRPKKPRVGVVMDGSPSVEAARGRAALHELSHPVFTWPQTHARPSVFPVVTVTHAGQRRTPKAAKTSSVFKKIVMAVSGILMLLFLIAHMVGNLHVFQGRESFNDYSEWLRSLGEPALPPRTFLTALEIVLVLAVLAHMWAAFSLWRQAKRARPERYVTKKSVAQSYASRTMRWGGVIVGLFIVYHILDLTFGVANPDGTGTTPYDRLVASFQNPIATTVYVIALILLGMHLRHGVWSATQTLGQSNRRRERTVNAFAIAFSVLLIAGYLVVPAAVVFGLVD